MYIFVGNWAMFIQNFKERAEMSKVPGTGSEGQRTLCLPQPWAFDLLTGEPRGCQDLPGSAISVFFFSQSACLLHFAITLLPAVLMMEASPDSAAV